MYNRVITPFSRLGSRQLHVYRITVTQVGDEDSLYDSAQDNPDNSFQEYTDIVAKKGISVETVDTYNYQIRWPNNSIYSSILNGVSDIVEIYYSGLFVRKHHDTDNNELHITTFVAADTFLDVEKNSFSNGSMRWNSSLIDGIYNRIQDFNWNAIDVCGVDIVGHQFGENYNPNDDEWSNSHYMNKSTNTTKSLRMTRDDIKLKGK